MRRTWVPNRGQSGNSSRHLSHALYKPNSSFHAASAAAAQSNTQLNTVPPVPHNSSHPSSTTLEIPHVEYGDYFPLLAGRSPEDQLTPQTTQTGYLLHSTHITDETRILSRSVPSLREKRARIKEKILEFSHVAPKKQRVSRSLPTPVIGLSKEAREEWLRLLSLEQVPLTELARLPIPHGVRGAAFLEEMSSRNVPHLRALWFLKLLSSQPDFIGGSTNIAANNASGANNISLGISSGGSANSRSSAFSNQIAARNRVWMEEIKKTLENLANEMAMAWKPASSASAAVLHPTTNGPSSTSAAASSSSSSLSIISSIDQTFLRQLLSQPPSISSNSFSASTPFAGLESQLQLCGLELTNQPVQGGGSSGPGSAPSNTPAGMSAAFASSSVSVNSAAATLSNVAGGTPASMQNSTATMSQTAESRWKRLLARWEYIFDLFELGLTDGIFSRGVFLSWISEHLLQLSAQNWNFCASLVRYLLFSHALIRVLPLVQLSRNHAHKLFQAMKLVYEKCLAIEYGYCNTISSASSSSSSSSTSPAASSSASATVWMQVAQPFMSQFVQVFIRYLSSVMPHTQAWFTQKHRALNVPFSINVSGNPSRLEAMDGWKWEWIHHFDDSSDEEDSDIEGDEGGIEREDSYDDMNPFDGVPMHDQSPSRFVCFDIDMGLDEPTVKTEIDAVVKMEDESAEATGSANGSASIASKSVDAKLHSSSSLSLVAENRRFKVEPASDANTASSFESLLYLSGGYSFSHQQSWQCFFPRLLNYLNAFSTATMESDPQSHFSIIPCMLISPRPVSGLNAPLLPVSPDRIHFAFHPSMNVPNASSTSVEMFDATSYLTQTTASLSSNSAILAHIHFLRSMIPQFHKGPLQLLLHWSIRGAIRTNTNALVLVMTILHTYLPSSRFSMKHKKQRSVASAASRQDISHAALEFLLAFRPASRLELTRLVRLYELLCCMQLFPYETFLERLLVTGVIHPELQDNEQQERRADVRVDLSDWISLGQYYLRHLPMPTPAVTGSGADSDSAPATGLPSTIDQCVLPGTAWKKSHCKLVLDRATPRLLELLDIKQNSMTGVCDKLMRTVMDLVYLDILWLWQNEFVTTTSGPASVVYNLHFLEFGRQKRQQLLQQGKYWHVDDRVIHAKTWRLRSRADAIDINCGEFPSSGFYLDPSTDEQHADRALSSLSEPNAIRNRSPILPAPACSAASLLFTLPLPSVSFLLDHMMHSLQTQIDSLSSENEKVRRFQLLASAEFNSILMQLVEMLELTESRILLQRTLFWCIDLLLAFAPPQSPPLPMLESLLFGLIRRHYSLIMCLGMSQTLKSKLAVLIRAHLGPQPTAGTPQLTAYGATLDAFLDSIALPSALQTSVKYSIFERTSRGAPPQQPLLQQQTSYSQHPFLSLSSEQQMYVDQMSWDMHLRRALQVCSCNVTDYSSNTPQNVQVSLYQVCAMVPLSAPGLATFLRELFRAFIQSSLGSVVVEGGLKPRAAVSAAEVEAISRSRSGWMQNKWNKLVQCIAHIEHRLLSSFLGIGGGGPARPSPNMNSSKINLTELFFAQLIRILFILINDINTMMSPVQQVLSQLEIPPATVVVLPSASLLQQHLTLFLLQVLTSDLGYSWRASKVMHKLSQAALNQAPELRQKEAIWRLCETIMLCESVHQPQIVVSSVHQLKLRSLIWQEFVLDYIPFARTFQEATKQQLLLTSAPLRMAFAMQPRAFFKDILPVLTSPEQEQSTSNNGLPRPVFEFVRTTLSVTEFHRLTDVFAVKSEQQQQQSSEEKLTCLLSMLTPWNTQTFGVIFQMLCMDLHANFKTKFDPSIVIRQMLVPCMSNAAALTPSSSCTSPLQPFEFGSRLECARQLLQAYAQATFVHEQLSSLLSHSFDLELQQLLVMHEHTAREQKDRSAKQMVESIVQSHYRALMHADTNNSKHQQQKHPAVQYDAFVASTFLLASPHPEQSTDPLPPLCLRLLDQISLTLAVALQTPFSALPTLSGLNEVSLHERIQQSLLKRIRSLYGLLSVIYSSRPLEYERLLKHILMLLMLVSEVPSIAVAEVQENPFFLQLLQLFQSMMDVVSFSADDGKAPAANRGGGGGIAPSTNGAPSSSSSMASGSSSTATGEQMLFELQGLFYMACRSLRMSDARRILIAQSFDNGHGALEEDVHLTTPFVSTGAAASANVTPLLQDPWMLLESLPSTPFIDLCFEQSRPATIPK